MMSPINLNSVEIADKQQKASVSVQVLMGTQCKHVFQLSSLEGPCEVAVMYMFAHALKRCTVYLQICFSSCQFPKL